MNKNLKLIINNPHSKIEEKQFFEKDELKIILDLYAKMVSGPRHQRHDRLQHLPGLGRWRAILARPSRRRHYWE